MKNKLLVIFTYSIFLIFGSAFAGEKYEFTGTAYNTSGFEAPIITASEAQIWNWSNDSFWIYDDAPEGWPKEVMADCKGKGIANKDGIPLAGFFMCTVHDTDGDLFLTSGSWEPAKGGGDWTFISGTGKFEGVTGGGSYLNGVQFMGGDTLNFVTSIEMPN
jgi:hypothetical protein